MIEKTDDKKGKYEKDFIKIKFNSVDDLPLNDILSLHNMAIVVRSLSQEDNKYHPQGFLDECLYEL